MKKFLTAASSGRDLSDDFPAEWPVIEERVPDDYVLTEDELARKFQLLPDEEFSKYLQQRRPLWNAYNASLVDDYTIPRALFIKRLTAAEYKSIRAAFQASAASDNPTFAMTWDSIGAGLVGPPDGYNEERRLCRQVRNALRDVVGLTSNRLEKVFAKP